MDDEGGGTSRTRGRSDIRRRKRPQKRTSSARACGHSMLGHKSDAAAFGSGGSRGDDLVERRSSDVFANVDTSGANPLEGNELLERKLPLRAPSNAKPRRGRSTPPPRTAKSGGTKQAYDSLEALQRERRRISLLLGNEQFPDEDVSAFLGDFSVPKDQRHAATDFPGVDMGFVSKAIKPAVEKKKKEKKRRKKRGSKSEAEGQGLRGRKGDEVNTASASTSRSDLSLAAIEALERSAIARHKGDLAKQLLAKRQQLMQKTEPLAIPSNSEASGGTTSSNLSSTWAPVSPWDTQGTPRHSPRRASTIQKLRSLIQTRASKKSLFQEMNDSSSSFELPFDIDNGANTAELATKDSGGNVNKSHKEAQKNKKKKKTRRPRKSKGSLGGRDMQESNNSLTLSDLEKSHSTVTTASEISSTANTTTSSACTLSILKRKTKSTQDSCSISTSQSSAKETSGSISTSQSSSKGDTLNESGTGVNLGCDEHVYPRSSFGSKSYTTETPILLDSLALDTVHETNEDLLSEATSKHTTCYLSDYDSPKHTLNRSFSTVLSIPKNTQIPENAQIINLSDELRLGSCLEEGQEDVDNNAVRKGRRSVTDIEHDELEMEDSINSDEESKRSTNSKLSSSDKSRSKKSHNSQTSGKQQTLDTPQGCRIRQSKTRGDEEQQKSYSLNAITPNAGGSGNNDARPHHGPERNLRHDDGWQIKRRGSRSTRDQKDDPTGQNSRQGNSDRECRSNNADRSKSRHSVSARWGVEIPPDSVFFWKDDPYYARAGNFRHGHIDPREHPHGWHGHIASRGHPYPHYGDPNAYNHHQRNRIAAHRDFEHRRRHANSHAGAGIGPPMNHPHHPSFYFYQHQAYPSYGQRVHGMAQGGHASWRSCHAIGDGYGYERSTSARLSTGHARQVPKRRHSIGSGHSRDSILDEINAAMDQEHKLAARERQNGEEPIIDISRHNDDTQFQRPLPSSVACVPRDLESRLNSSGTGDVSIFETFGINYPDEYQRNRAANPQGGRAPRRRLDEELHSWYHPSPTHVPLYHRPDGFDIHEYVLSAREGRLRNGDNFDHRGRRIRSSRRDDTSLRKPSGRSTPLEKRWSGDDGSLRYPPRKNSIGSFSGRTTLGSADDTSMHSFAI